MYLSSVSHLRRSHVFETPSCAHRNKNRSKSFVMAFNSALEELAKVDGLPLRPPSDLEVMFCRNYPSLITATHNGTLSHRRPDIIMVPLAAARTAFGLSDTAPWRNLALKNATKQPIHSFTWEDPLLSLKMEMREKELESVSGTYDENPITEIAHLTFEQMRQELYDSDYAYDSDDSTTLSSISTTDSIVLPTGKMIDRFTADDVFANYFPLFR